MSAPTAPPAAGARGPRAWWRALAPRTRRLLRVLLAAGAIVVVAVSIVLARFLSVENTERDADLALVQAQARGDANAMIDQLSGCRASPSCVAAVKANVANPRLRRPGAVKILSQLSYRVLAHGRHGQDAPGVDGDRHAARGAVRGGASHGQPPDGHPRPAAGA